jgi:ketosteroid isomerase-like protein
MSRENVEIVRQAWRDFKDGGTEATLDYYSENCVCEDVPGLPDRAIYRGLEGVLERGRHFREMWRDFDLEPVEFIDAGDDVVVVVTAIHGHGRESAAPIESEVAFVYDIRDGKAIRDRAFASRGQALEAAGMSE